MALLFVAGPFAEDGGTLSPGLFEKLSGLIFFFGFRFSSRSGTKAEGIRLPSGRNPTTI